MRLPRDVSSTTLVKALARLGYQVDHQTGSHIRLTTLRGGEHHVTVPAHDPIKVGTLNNILREAASHAHLGRNELLRLLFD